MVASRRVGRVSAGSPFAVNRLQPPKGELELTDHGIMMGWRRDADNDRYLWRINHWLMPVYSLIPGGGGDVERGILVHAQVPIDDETSWTYQVRYRPDAPLSDELLKEDQDGSDPFNQFAEVIPGTFQAKANKHNDYLIDREAQRTNSFTGIPSIPQQDRMVTESMGAITDRTREHLCSSDVAIIQLRRRLLDMAKALEDGIEPSAASHGKVYRIRPLDVLLDRDKPWVETVERQIQVCG
jgi:hypothetical protein